MLRRRPPSKDGRNGELSSSSSSAAAAAAAARKISSSSSSSSSSSFATEVLALLLIALFYFSLFWIASKCVHEGYLRPLPKSAPLDKFSEERAMKHVWHLAHTIGGRQEGSVGLARAAEYLKDEITVLKDRSKSVRLELDESLVSGSFSMYFLKHNVALAYRNHTNVAVRVSAHNATDDQPAVLVNGHFDSPLGSPGAGDCASCVSSMLEVLRYIVDSGWIPPSPIIFLFNGAEEVFLLASHGFITTHKWRSTVGAVINVEATGASGPDLVVQSGPETWPTRVYAESAVVPGANSIAQDVFPLVPGDTDYRIFSQDFADIPGMDIVFLLNGYVYHTAYDRPEIIAPGSIQTRGENLIAILKGFASAPELKTAEERARAGGSNTDRHVYFDLLGKFMVHYSWETARVLHFVPLIVVLAVPHFFRKDVKASYSAILDGAIRQGLGCFLAILFPIVLAILRLIVSPTAMIWFSDPRVAGAIFVPASIAGLLLPRVIYASRQRLTQDAIFASHWGATGLYALEAVVLTLSGAMSSYFPCWWAMLMIPAFQVLEFFQRRYGQHSLRSLLAYILPGLLPSIYSIFFICVFVEFIVEKLGMVGSHPDPFGFFIADVVIAFIVGLAVVVSVGHIIPGVAHVLGKPRVIWLLLATSAAISAGFSGRFPYSTAAPKRIILQHTFRTSGDAILEETHDFSTVDPNPMGFVLKHAPAVHETLIAEPKPSQHSAANTFLALYPISLMLSQSVQVPAIAGPPYQQASLPKLVLVETTEAPNQGTRRLFFELDLGSLQEVWGTAMNVTGPLLNWSLSNQSLPEIVHGSTPSYVCRFSGESSENWKFWMDAKISSPLRIEVGVLDQRLDQTTVVLMEKFPPWAAVVAGTTYLSSYEF